MEHSVKATNARLGTVLTHLNNPGVTSPGVTGFLDIVEVRIWACYLTGGVCITQPYVNHHCRKAMACDCNSLNRPGLLCFPLAGPAALGAADSVYLPSKTLMDLRIQISQSAQGSPCSDTRLTEAQSR